MDEWKRFANAAVQEELIAQAEALRARVRLRYAEGGSPRTSTRRRTSCTRSRSAGSRRADAPRVAGADALASLSPGRGSDPDEGARVLRRARVEREGQPQAQAGLLIERAEALATSTDWIKTADEMKKLQAEWQELGPVPPPRHPRRLEAVPRRVRQPSSRAATRIWPSGRKSGRPTRQGKKRCARAPRSSRPRPTGRRRRERAPPAAGRLEECRAGAPHQVRSAVAAVPDGVRHVLRSLQAARRDRDRIEAGGSRSARHRSSSRSGRHATPTRRAERVRGRGRHRDGRGGRRRSRDRRAAGARSRRARGPARKDPLTAHPVEPVDDGGAPGRGSAERTLHERDGARPGRRIRTRSRTASSTSTRTGRDGEAGRPGRELPETTTGSRSPGRISPRASARRSRRTRLAAAPARNPSGAAWRTKCATRSRRSRASVPVPGETGKELGRALPHGRQPRSSIRYRRKVPQQ